MGLLLAGLLLQADPAVEGRRLARELGCGACHAVDPGRGLDPKRGPRLDGVGVRLQPSWIHRYLDDPRAVHPGVTMPDLLAGIGGREREETIEALVHLLGSSTKPPGKQRPLPRHGNRERGVFLYREYGCAACHGAAPDFPDPAGKHRMAPLMNFLLDPLALRSSGRMPDLQLDVQDASDIAAFLLGREDAENKTVPKVRPMKTREELVRKGREAFVRIGCANCHALGDLKSGVSAPPWKDLRAEEPGCLGPARRGLPSYGLSASEKEALRKVVGRSDPVDARGRVEDVLASFNCRACHARGGRGGATGEREALFQGDPALADEGRFPPALDGVGRKLTPAWMAEIFSGKGRLRPYLRTRMPSFGAENLESFIGDVIETDGGMKETADKVFQGGDVESGRRLLGGDGGLSCITCHDLGKRTSIGIPGLNLAGATKRLQPRWFRENLLDPSRMRPRTLMPTFWPEGRSVNRTIHDGNADFQVASIWAYLESGTKEPPGYPPPKGRFELVPDKAPVVLRGFIKGAGTHAIAVGYPAGVHLAYDGEHVRPALMWRGRFLDAYSTWFSRYQPPVEPLGSDVRRLPAGTIEGKGTVRFGGYRLDGEGVPEFRWSVGKVRVRDRIVPIENGAGLKRMLIHDGGDGRIGFRPGSAAGVEVRGSGERILLEPGGRVEVEYRWK